MPEYGVLSTLMTEQTQRALGYNNIGSKFTEKPIASGAARKRVYLYRDTGILSPLN